MKTEYKCPWCGTVIFVADDGKFLKPERPLITRVINDYARCRDCKYIDLTDKTSIGYGCTFPKHWARDITRYKPLHTRACGNFEVKERERNNGSENINT